MRLSQEKTLITHLERGFDFLAFNVRKYNGKLLIKPAKKNIAAFLQDIRLTLRSRQSVPSGELIRILNPKIRGWANYYRHGVSKKAFSYVDDAIFHAIWKWATRRHPKKGARWVQQRYFQRQGLRSWIFSGQSVTRQGEVSPQQLFHAGDTRIRRHIKVRCHANPYDASFDEYFEQRSKRNRIQPSRADKHP